MMSEIGEAIEEQQTTLRGLLKVADCLGAYVIILPRVCHTPP